MLPDYLFQILRGFQESRALLTGVELDLFTHIGSGGAAEEIAARMSTDVRATEMLLNALVAMGVLSKSDGVFRNTPDAAKYLTASGARMALMHHVNMWTRWSTLTECVRQGTSVLYGQPSTPESTQAFIAAMHFIAGERARQLAAAVGPAGVRKLLDVGGGSGAYSIAFAQANPELRAVVLDRPVVTPIAKKHIAEAGVADRVSVRDGDLTRDHFPSGFDTVLLSAICHMLGPEENVDLLRRCHAALEPGGRIVIADFLLDPDKTGPRMAALFSLNMLVGTERGASYSETEYREWLLQTGFGTATRTDIPQGVSLLIAQR